MNSTIFRNKRFKTLIILLLWLAVWEIVSLFVHNNILLVGPVEVIVALFHKCLDLQFYMSVGMSLLKIMAGYLCGAIAGILLAILSFRYPVVEDVLEPFVAFLKAAPVASFVVIFLIWWHSSVLSIAICICVVFPQIYVGVLEGIRATDTKLIEMSEVFALSIIDRLNYVYRPYVCPFLEGSVKVSAGMAWKAGVAAEVIGTPAHSIGNDLYMSKISLDTAGVLAWTCVIIFISVICERLLLLLLNTYKKHEFRCLGIAKRTGKKQIVNTLTIDRVCKSFAKHTVLDNYSEVLERGKCYTLNWGSGCGKTTLFNIIAGLKNKDAGVISPAKYDVSMLFQEDRLFDNYSVLVNLEVVYKNRDALLLLVDRLLPGIDISRPVCELSGGEKRRVAILRACLKESDIVLFDEPFEGLDEENRKIVKEFIEESCKDRIVFIASHIEV